MITQKANLSLVPGIVPPVIHVSQFDTGERSLEFTITDNGVDFSGTSLRIDGIKPDGNAFSYTSADISLTRNGSVITSDCVTQMTACAGEVRCALLFMNGDDRLESADFILSVKKAAIDNDSVISDTDLPSIIELAREQELHAAASAEAAAESEENAEAWAVGQRGGEDVSSDDPTYENNSKYYAEEASDSASAASSSEQNAAASESAAEGYSEDAEAWAVGQRDGTDVESDDPTYQNNSKYYAEQAADSADDAEDAASDSEAWANGTRNGSNIGPTDEAYQKNSKYWADLAGIYADYVFPHFIIENNRLYLRDDSTPVFVVANNRIYIKTAA